VLEEAQTVLKELPPPKEGELGLTEAQAAMGKLKDINRDTENSVEECFKLLENLSLSTNFTSAVSE